MPSIYDVTFVGSNLPMTKLRKVAENPQDAINAALGINAEKAKTVIKYLCTGEAALQANATFKQQANARVSKVKQNVKDRESINYYHVDVAYLTKNKAQADTTETRLSLEEVFKKAAEKEREREINAVSKMSDADFEQFVRDASLINYKKKLDKEGKSADEVKKEIAKENFRKQSTDYKEMLMQSKALSNDYEIVDHTQFQNVFEALSNGACMVLAKKQKGGVTGYFCTGSTDVTEKVYGSKDFYTLLQLTDCYANFFNITKRKVDDIKANRQYKGGVVQGKTSVKVASCDVRLRQVINKKTNQPVVCADGHDKFTISSLDYTLVWENILCLVRFSSVNQTNAQVTDLLTDLTKKDTRDIVEDRYSFDFEAWDCAKKLYAYRMNAQAVDMNKFANHVMAVVNEKGKNAGLSQEDIDIYVNAKIEKQMAELDYILDKFQTGYCMTIYGPQENRLLDLIDA